LLLWSRLPSALVLDMRPVSESPVGAAAVTTTLIQRIDRVIYLSAQTAPSQYSLLSAAIGVLGKIKVEVALATTIRIIPIVAVAIMIGLSPANGSPACMTESEARAKFPKAHLIWLGTNHCWTFGVARVHSRRPALAAEPSRPVSPAEPSAAQCRYSPCE
jgi:hypothetical protein